MTNQRRQATRDQIVSAIHVLWERDQLISEQAIQDQLHIGQHVVASLRECQNVYQGIASSRDAWLAQYDPLVLAERRKRK